MGSTITPFLPFLPCPRIPEIALLLMDCITITPACLMGKQSTFPINKREAPDGGLLDEQDFGVGV
jgi:hypothetical protein